MPPMIPISPQSLQHPGLQASPPLALYVHYPWCVRKCPYCDFNSHQQGANATDDAWLAAVIADLEAALPRIWGRRVHSIFIGGGTPSLMSAEILDRLLTDIRMRVPLDPQAEITLEANPGTYEIGKFAAFRAAGVNRLSMGIQSFNPRHLQALGRIHGRDEALAAIAEAARHFETFNLDLMYGLPEQTLAEALEDIETALQFNPPHLSCYHLTLEPNTPFHHAPPPLPDDDVCADMQEAIEARLAAHGLENYEISAFARQGHRCRHNLNYWTFGDYLGIGPGAHGKLSAHDGIRRDTRERNPKAYLAAAAQHDFVRSERQISPAELPFEFMMNAARLIDGFPTRLFTERTGLGLHAIEKHWIAARQRGLLEANAEWIRPTVQGRRFLNELLEMFLGE